MVDADEAAARALTDEAAQDQRVDCIAIAHNIEEAQRELRAGAYNTIVIDPLSVGIDPAAQFARSAKGKLSEIVFVLFVDSTEVDARRAEFFSGESRRFAHYYSLDKRTPVAAFSDEVRAMLTRCASLLSWRLSAESLKRIREMVRTESSEIRSTITSELSAELDRAISLVASNDPAPTSRRTVFLSHRFAESEYVDGLTQLLEKEGFTVATGSPANTYISQAILQRISESDYFVCLMTRDKEKADGNYTTSPWLLEEKGAALALKKPVVLLVEHGVDEFGGLQGDWQRIHFGPKGYLSAALQAVGQLNSYAGS
ncbi:MAG: toll/interleukin-1 receptor domain-containing protein [Pseudonocardiaceae bacterium]